MTDWPFVSAIKVAAAAVIIGATGQVLAASDAAVIGQTAAPHSPSPSRPGSAGGSGRAIAGPQGAPGNSRPSDAVSATDLAVLQKLHDGNQMEIQMGHLAQTKGSSVAVKAYGRKLVSDHTAADKQLADFLEKRGLALGALATTTSADPSHSRTADQLGPSFDRAFGVQMATDHQRTIELVENARIKTMDSELKALYGQLLQILQDHKKMAQTIAGDGGTGKRPRNAHPQGRPD